MVTTLARSEEELRLWVELVRGARLDGLDLDHALARVRERTAERYADFLADPERVARYEHLNADRSNLVGIMRWLDRVEPLAG